MDLNKVTLIGNVTRAPESRALPSGKSVTAFSLATSERWNGDKSEGERVEFFDVQAFGKLGEIVASYVKAGAKLYVEGRLHSRTTKGKDGAPRRYVEVVADNLILLGHRSKRETPLRPKEAR